MLSRLTVAGFKSLADCTVDLGNINVFIGANGAGKSNLLEAVGVVSAAISGRVDDESIIRRGVRPGVPALYKTSFTGAHLPKHIRFEAEGYGAKYAVSLYNPIDKPKGAWRYKNELLTDEHETTGHSPASYGYYDDTASWVALQLATVRPDSARGLLASELRDYAIYAPDTPTLRGIEPDSQNREPVGLSGGRLPEAVAEVLTQSKREFSTLISDVDWIQSMGISATSSLPISTGVPQRRIALKFVDRYMISGRNVLSGYDASEGILYLLFCSVLALHAKSPRVFAIDNFDQALNPRMARRLAALFCEWLLQRSDRQAFLTTHNPLVLDGLPLLDGRVRLFAVDRNLAGRTVVNRILVTDQMMAESKSGKPLSMQWVSGNFGGVPNGV